MPAPLPYPPDPYPNSLGTCRSAGTARDPESGNQNTKYGRQCVVTPTVLQQHPPTQQTVYATTSHTLHFTSQRCALHCYLPFRRDYPLLAFPSAEQLGHLTCSAHATLPP